MDTTKKATPEKTSAPVEGATPEPKEKPADTPDTAHPHKHHHHHHDHVISPAGSHTPYLSPGSVTIRR